MGTMIRFPVTWHGAPDLVRTRAAAICRGLAGAALLAVVAVQGARGAEDEDVIRIYQDADRTNSATAAIAIERGIRVALDEVGNRIDGRRVELVLLDHRGNVIRSKRNFERFINDPNAMAIFSGAQSPPLIRNRTFINKNNALTLVPWAAGGPVTRHNEAKNFTFRLSVDDDNAGHSLIRYALNEKRCRAPHLLLINNPWGDSNLKTMSEAMHRAGRPQFNVTRFNINLSAPGARTILRQIVAAKNDCIVLVAGNLEGATIAEAMLALPKRQWVPIISHWGVTAGRFAQVIGPDRRAGMDLHFIQTCFSFIDPALSAFAARVFDRARRMFSDIDEPSDLQAPAGFVHAYDLTRLLLAATASVDLSQDMNTVRDQIRLRLEVLGEPVRGLLKTYRTPFSPYHPVSARNAHEALGETDYCMAEFGPRNEIRLVTPAS